MPRDAAAGMAGGVIALSVRGLTVGRAGRSVLEDVTFNVPAGTLAAVLGPAGGGKTTLLAAIAGLLKPERGAVLVDGADVSRLPARRRPVGFLPGDSGAPSGRRARAALGVRAAALGLAAPSTQPWHRLSHGEAGLALTAARLAPSGPVLLVDEAGEGLEPAARLAMLSLLRAEAASGRAVLLATRDPAVALDCDALILLAGGRLLQSGTPAELYDAPRDAACALLTGQANILRGTVREVRPGGFVWITDPGSRHLQSALPGAPRPTLGSRVTLCLRPERIALLDAASPADNVLDGSVLQSRPAGPMLEVVVRTAPGPLDARVPSWRRAPAPAPGQLVRLGWPADAAAVLADG